VQGICPPKPAGLDTPNFCSQTLKWMWNVDSQEKIENNILRKFSEFFLNFFFREISYRVAEICAEDPPIYLNVFLIDVIAVDIRPGSLLTPSSKSSAGSTSSIYPDLRSSMSSLRNSSFWGRIEFSSSSRSIGNDK
jgi:hypothetical protein